MRIIILILIALSFTGCAAGPDHADFLAEVCKDPAGFGLGLWHGTIAPITFFISLFKDSVTIYDVCNTGGWYNFGFILGVGGSFGSSAGARRPYRRGLR